MPTQPLRPPNSCFSRSSFDLPRGPNSHSFTTFRAFRNRDEAPSLFLSFRTSIHAMPSLPPSRFYRPNNRKEAPSRRIEREGAADKTARRPREGWRLASEGLQKLFRHGVAGGDTAEHDALADIARALVHVAPDRTELASGVQVLDRGAALLTPRHPSQARSPLRLQ